MTEQTNKYTNIFLNIQKQVKEMQFKIINGYYSAAEMLKKGLGLRWRNVDLVY